jgi:hypothetical protein
MPYLKVAATLVLASLLSAVSDAVTFVEKSPGGSVSVFKVSQFGKFAPELSRYVVTETNERTYVSLSVSSRNSLVLWVLQETSFTVPLQWVPMGYLRNNCPCATVSKGQRGRMSLFKLQILAWGIEYLPCLEFVATLAGKKELELLE